MQNGDQDVVHLEGELDMATQELAFAACMRALSMDVVVDVSNLSFLDCSGYGRLVAAQKSVEQRGGSLRFRGAVGQPARLLDLLAIKQQLP